MNTQVWYMKPTYFRDGMMGHGWCKENNILPDPKKLEQTHVLLKELPPAMSLERVFRNMQGGNWSPNGEARPLVREKGLKHTSMSVGDVIVNDDGVFMVDPIGFMKL